MESEPKRGRGLFDGWSKSSLKSLLEGCSWQWALQRIGGLEGGSTPHSAAGTGLHAAIEWHEQCRIDGLPTPDEAELILAAYHEATLDGGNIPPNLAAIHGGPEQAAQWAAELTHTWYHSDVREKMLTYTPLAVERHYEVSVYTDKPTLRGYLDWIGRDEDGVVTVVDYKSAADTRRWTDADKHLVEAAVYLYLASTDEAFENEPVRMEWHVIPRRGEPTILRGPTMNPDLAYFIFQQLAAAQTIMDEAAYKPNPSWNLCSDRWCNFYHGCQVSGQLSPDEIQFPTPAEAPIPPSPPDGPEG